MQSSGYSKFGVLTSLGCLALAAACAGETQPLNAVGEEAGGSSGSGGSSESGGSGGSSSGGTANHTTGSSGGVTSTSGATSSGAGGSSAGGSSSGVTTTGGDPGPRKAFADKLDLLFVVDNSIGMSEKQAYLARAARNLIGRLVEVPCSEDTSPGGAPGDTACPDSPDRGFEPLKDIHIGVISTSLGSHGGDICSPDGSGASSWNETKNDRAHLMGTVRDDLNSFDDQGFLVWSPDTGEGDLEALGASLAEHIVAAGNIGCGYEAPLEAMYRFLVDPAPAANIVVENNQTSGPELNADGTPAVDEELLAQRADFLRPDAALAVVLLSDEDDCSIVDSGIGWLTAQATTQGGSFTMPTATSVCETDPNDACCRSCGLNEASPPAGCAPLAQDPACASPRPAGTDALNLRCFDQKRRFGFDLLYPIERYVAGFNDEHIHDTVHCDSNGNCPLVRNPLFPATQSDGTFTRTPRDVFVMSLVGVPWQDLATSDSLEGSELTYKSEVGELNQNVWDLVVGDPSNYVLPDDPFMRASIDARSGENPVTGDVLGTAAVDGPLANAINGHESINRRNDSLQFACTFDLEEPRDCLDANERACACTQTDLERESPLCYASSSSSVSTNQYRDGASPGLRQLDLMRRLPGGIPASICPKLGADDASDDSYGYNPAMRALVHELSSALVGSSSKD